MYIHCREQGESSIAKVAPFCFVMPLVFPNLRWSRAENVPTVHLLYEGKTERRKQDIRKNREKRIHILVRLFEVGKERRV